MRETQVMGCFTVRGAVKVTARRAVKQKERNRGILRALREGVKM